MPYANMHNKLYLAKLELCERFGLVMIVMFVLSFSGRFRLAAVSIEGIVQVR